MRRMNEGSGNGVGRCDTGFMQLRMRRNERRKGISLGDRRTGASKHSTVDQSHTGEVQRSVVEDSLIRYEDRTRFLEYSNRKIGEGKTEVLSAVIFNTMKKACICSNPGTILPHYISSHRTISLNHLLSARDRKIKSQKRESVD